MIFFIFFSEVISWSVLNPNSSWRLSVRSVLVQAGMQPSPGTCWNSIDRRVPTISDTVYFSSRRCSSILYMSSAMKHTRKWAVILSFLERKTGLALNSLLSIRKLSSISHLLLLMSTTLSTESSRFVHTAQKPSYMASDLIFSLSRESDVPSETSPVSLLKLSSLMNRDGSFGLFLSFFCPFSMRRMALEIWPSLMTLQQRLYLMEQVTIRLCLVPCASVQGDSLQKMLPSCTDSSTLLMSQSLSDDDPSSFHPTGLRHHSLMSLFSFFIDWVVMNARLPMELNLLFEAEASPASVQTTILECLKSFMILLSSFLRDGCSLSLPGKRLNARGQPLPSIKSPI